MITFNGYKLRDLDIAELLSNVTRGLSEEENNLDNLIKLSNASVSIEEPNYRILASNLFYNEIENGFNEFKKLNNINSYYDYLKYMCNKNYYDKKILELYRKQDIDLVSTYINESYNYEYDYAGMNILAERYLIINQDKKVIESPEYMYMTIALFIASVEKNTERLEKVRQIYDATHSRKISLATPILLNCRRIAGSLSSCYILSTSDSLLSINQTMNNINLISQNAGGVGLNIGRIRAEGSMIRGIPNASSGVMSWVKIADSCITAVNQTGKRRGSITIALPIWHYDFEEFLHCQTENGDLRKKAFNIFPQVIIPDLFMECVKSDSDWYMFCPYEYNKEFGNDINELVGKDFEAAYHNAISSDKIRKKKVKAKELFKEILKTQLETGLPYIFFTDTVNKVNPNIHEGTIENGNLCVAPETLLLTDKGEIPIIDLVDKEVNVWNGKQWSLSKVFKTGENQSLMKIDIESWHYDSRRYKMHTIYCTEYHKFYDQNGNEIRAKDLKEKETVLNYLYMPNGDGYSFRVDKIEFNSRLSDTYCVTEPIHHKVVFNGVLTGNCMESISPFKASKVNSKPYLSNGTSLKQDIISGLAHTCNLVSLNLAIIEDNELQEMTALSVNILDNTIDISEAPIPESKLHNEFFRILGVGTVGLADYLAKNKLTYKSGLNKISEIAEKIAYYALTESVRLSKERCPYPLFEGSQWSKGIVFGKDKGWFENNKTYIDTKDWLSLLGDIQRFGLRNGGILSPAPNCQNPNNKIRTNNGNKSIYNILEENLIDYKNIEKENIPQWIYLKERVFVPTFEGDDYCDRIWFNGKKETISIEFEDGNIYEFTPNHKLLVDRNGSKVWVRCDELNEGDDIVSI